MRKAIFIFSIVLVLSGSFNQFKGQPKVESYAFTFGLGLHVKNSVGQLESDFRELGMFNTAPSNFFGNSRTYPRHTNFPFMDGRLDLDFAQPNFLSFGFGIGDFFEVTGFDDLGNNGYYVKFQQCSWFASPMYGWRTWEDRIRLFAGPAAWLIFQSNRASSDITTPQTYYRGAAGLNGGLAFRYLHRHNFLLELCLDAKLSTPFKVGPFSESWTNNPGGTVPRDWAFPETKMWIGHIGFTVRIGFGSRK